MGTRALRMAANWTGPMAAALALLMLPGLAGAVTPASSARIIPIDSQAWAGSSVNVLAGVRQTLFTEGVHQYAAYYGADATLTLAKRRIGEDRWQIRRTAFKGNATDAHNHISLVVDGAGYLHVAWDHHNDPLHYARSTTPGGLELGAPAAMRGDLERAVTYPQFHRLPDGDLLFLYRSGGSGNGQTVMNRYRSGSGRWERVHSNLIDGQGKRSAYWDMTVDKGGVLHLAWVWRESGDVATNHDLAYARSQDGGATWTGLDGQALALPLTEAGASYALKIAQHSNLMNSPVVAADSAGRPFITTYWSPAPGATPRFHVVYGDKQAWKVIAGPESGKPFTLAGHDTKFPPISRASLLIENRGPRMSVNLIYRNHLGQVTASTIDNLDKPVWIDRPLTSDSVGAWEPSYDPVQWARLGQAQMLVQQVQQQDGNDKQAARSASALGVLAWGINWERHQQQHAAPTAQVAADLAAPLRKAGIAALAQKTADWQWNHLPAGKEYEPRLWTMAPFYIGSLAAAEKMPLRGQRAAMLAQGERLEWKPAPRIYDADDQCVIQAYLALYLRHRDPKMLAPSKERLDFILAQPSGASLDWGSPKAHDRWSWSDALFMGPMSWLLMYRATGEERYLDFMNREWWAATERLYRPAIGMYFRDESFLDLRERNGKTIHWARGTGWSVAGLVQILEHLPKGHKDAPRYRAQYKEMAAAFLAAQQADGLWRPGILDPQTHTARETSGSAFIAYALAWGLNHKVLDQKTYGAAVVKAWNGLAASVEADGKLRDVQPIGAAPHGFDPNNAEPFATGAFLLAASEVYGLAR